MTCGHQPARLRSCCDAHVPTVATSPAGNEARRSHTAEHIASAGRSGTAKCGVAEQDSGGASGFRGAAEGNRAGMSLGLFHKTLKGLWCSDTLVSNCHHLGDREVRRAHLLIW